MYIFPLSSVTGINVISVFPKNFEQKTKHFRFLNRSISSCKTHDNFTKNLVQEVYLIIMWTTRGKITLLGLFENFQPNLFVTCVGMYLQYSKVPVQGFVCVSFTRDNLNYFRVK